jgi:hypothetical protein
MLASRDGHSDAATYHNRPGNRPYKLKTSNPKGAAGWRSNRQSKKPAGSAGFFMRFRQHRHQSSRSARLRVTRGGADSPIPGDPPRLDTMPKAQDHMAIYKRIGINLSLRE